MNDIITPEDRAYLERRYRVGGTNSEATIQYGINSAHEYADTYARDMPAFVKRLVAQLYIRYLLAHDRSDKMEIRCAIDVALQIGRGCIHARST